MILPQSQMLDVEPQGSILTLLAFILVCLILPNSSLLLSFWNGTVYFVPLYIANMQFPPLPPLHLPPSPPCPSFTAMSLLEEARLLNSVRTQMAETFLKLYQCVLCHGIGCGWWRWKVMGPLETVASLAGVGC